MAGARLLATDIDLSVLSHEIVSTRFDHVVPSIERLHRVAGATSVTLDDAAEDKGARARAHPSKRDNTKLHKIRQFNTPDHKPSNL